MQYLIIIYFVTLSFEIMQYSKKYMARWPEYFQVAESPAGDLMGYIMGKSEGLNENWHGHVTAVGVDVQLILS